MFLCIALIMPMALDWITQSWRIRESNNRLRFATGALMGIAVPLFLTINAPTKMRIEFYLFTGLVILITGLLGKKRCNLSNCS